MINAHIEQSSVYWAQHEKKLYKFRILELSEPFCDGRNGNTVLSRSCDNVTQKLRQLDHKRCKRPSEPAIANSIPSGTNLRQNRTNSLPVDLKTLVSHDYFSEKTKRNSIHHPLLENHSECTLQNGCDENITSNNHHIPDISVEEEEQYTKMKSSRNRCEQPPHSIKDKKIFDEVADAHFTEMKSSLRDLSLRFDERMLQTKSKEELISIILELQDALRLSTDD